MNPWLEVEVGKQVGARFEIPPESEGGEVFLGRDPFCKIRLFDVQLSRRHCRLSYDGSRLVIKDLDSKNGTKINGRPISHKTALRHGDHINVGSCRLVAKYPETVQPRKGLSPVWRHKTEAELLAEQAGDLVGREFADHQVEAKLWDGELATIYRARKAGQASAVALKILRPDANPTVEQENRFVRGARLGVRLTHPGLVRMLEFGRHMEISYAAMELAEGANLQLLLEKVGRPMKLDVALAIACRMLEALQYVYEQECVLRSVSPENVIVLKDQKVKLADFDLLKQLPSVDTSEVTRVIERSLWVDPSFAAPEVLADPLAADQRADVFGAGVCLYFMLTRVAPFPKSLPEEVRHKAFDRTAQDPRALNPKLPQAVCDVILTAMSAGVDDRYPTPQEMLAAIEEARNALA